MFYTGSSSTDRGLKQRTGMATSDDLYTWHKHPDPVLAADARWYEQLGDTNWPDEAWRDPWVFADPDGDGWHMLITARAAIGSADQRGVVGHARSHDLRHWTAQPPLSMPGTGFGQLEVMQVATVRGRPVLLFSCLHDALCQQRQAARTRGGIWSATAASLQGPFDVAASTRLADESLYSGRLIHNRSGQPALLAFRNIGTDGHFIGEITDPMPVTWSATDRLTLISPRPMIHF